MARLIPGRHVVERIVGRYRPVRIDPQNFSERAIETLRLARVLMIAHRHVQLAVDRAEVDRTAHVPDRIADRRKIGQLEQDHFAAGDHRVALRSQPAHAIVARRARRRVIDVDKAVACKIRVQRDARQPALAGRIHAERRERLRVRVHPRQRCESSRSAGR